MVTTPGNELQITELVSLLSASLSKIVVICSNGYVLKIARVVHRPGSETVTLVTHPNPAPDVY